MGKIVANLRFGVKRNDGFVSNVWRLWATKHGDVYLTTNGMGGIHKYSFHQSGVCRSAFTSEYGTPKTMTDRAIHKWKRTPTPPTGSGNYSRLAWIAFPSEYLSRETAEQRKKTTWLQASPAQGATYVEVAVTSDDEKHVKHSLNPKAFILLFKPMKNSESIMVISYFDAWENKDLFSPTSPDSIFPDLQFSANDPDDTGRPIRIVFGPEPSENDALLLTELGGYKVNA